MNKRILIAVLGLLALCGTAFAQTPTPLAVTGGSVIASERADLGEGKAGGALTAGDAIYLDDDHLLKKATAGGSALSSQVIGIALNNTSASGQAVTFARYDPEFTPGATLVTGTLYFLDTTAGKMTTAAGLTTGSYGTFICKAISTSQCFLKPISSGAVVP